MTRTRFDAISQAMINASSLEAEHRERHDADNTGWMALALGIGGGLVCYGLQGGPVFSVAAAALGAYAVLLDSRRARRADYREALAVQEYLARIAAGIVDEPETEPEERTIPVYRAGMQIATLRPNGGAWIALRGLEWPVRSTWFRPALEREPNEEGARQMKQGDFVGREHRDGRTYSAADYGDMVTAMERAGYATRTPRRTYITASYAAWLRERATSPTP